MGSYLSRKGGYRALWQQVLGFPCAPRSSLVYYPILDRVINQPQRIDKILKSPNYLNPVLISDLPGWTERRAGSVLPDQSLASTRSRPDPVCHRFLPMTEVASAPLAQTVRAMLRVRRRIALWSFFYWLSITTGFVAVGVYRVALVWSVISGVGAVYYWWDYQTLKSTPGLLRDRFWFYGWLYSHCRPYLLYSAGFAGLIGLSQVYMTRFPGLFDDLLMQGAVIFDHREQFNWTRYFTAPLLHTSLVHYMSNCAVIFMLAVLAGPLLGARYFVLLYFSAAGSLFVVDMAARYLSFQGDGIVGLSGGLAGVLGWLLGLSLRCQHLFPGNYYLNLLVLLLVMLLVLPLAMSLGGFICHLAGCMLGLCLVLIWPIHRITSGWAQSEDWIDA